MKKRLLSIQLVLCMLLTLLPVIAWAADSGSCGENLTWAYDNGILTINGEGSMDNFGYDDGARPWDSYRDQIVTVDIGDNVTSIGAYAFFNCKNLTNATIPDGITSIGGYAFLNCGLTSVTIPDSVTTIGEYAFYSCNSLTSVTIPGNVTSIGMCAFSNCSGLSSINVANNNFSFFSVDGVLFSADQAILYTYPVGKSNTYYIIPSSVTTIGGRAFDYCSNLTSITIPESVTTIEAGAFYNCSGLTSVTIPAGVTSIEAHTFEKCDNLTDAYYGGSESQWQQLEISAQENTALLNAQIHYSEDTSTSTPEPEPGSATTDEFTITEFKPAVKYVYYSVQIPGSWRLVSKASWMSFYSSSSGSVLRGMPTEAGEYSVTFRVDSEEQTFTITVRENGDNSVRASVSEGYRIGELPDIIDGDLTWTISEARTSAQDEAEIVDRLVGVYVDGTKLTGGSLAEGEQIPANWGYYFRRGSDGGAEITLLDPRKSSSENGERTLSVTFTPTGTGASGANVLDTASAKIFYLSETVSNSEKYPFSDGAVTRYRSAISALAKSRVADGFDDGSFHPRDGLTRAQACSILARVTGNENTGGNAYFSDTTGHWAEAAIAWCASNGIVSGYGNDLFGPDDPLTGYAWVKMVFCALGFDVDEYGMSGNDWEDGVMRLLLTYGLDQGINNFYLERTVKREEAFQLTYNAFVKKLVPTSA